VFQTQPVEDILELYNLAIGIGENYVQELEKKLKTSKRYSLVFIGHFQTNKVRSIISFIYLIHFIHS
jgi:uncharacterized pyridoxal phosphate-containing UPF0001 family protein